MPVAIVDFRKIYYELHGDHPGTPLVLIQGMGGSCRGWLPLQIPAFAEKHRVLIFDMPGVGESEDTGQPFTTPQLAEQLALLLAQVGVVRADVLGSSLGGMVAQELALAHPELVDRLILVGTYARPDAKRRLLIRQWRDLALTSASLETNIRERLIWTLQDETLEQTDLIDAMVEFYTRDAAPLSGDVFARQCDACLDHDTADRLRAIGSPTLVLCGRQDAFTPPKFHRELADEIPDAHLVTFSYGAHLVMAESAERFNETVLRFLEDGHPTPGSAEI